MTQPIQNREFTRYEKIIPLDLNIDGFQRGKAVQGGGGFREIIEAIETDKELSGKLDIITPRSKFGVLLNYNGNNFFAFGKIVDFEKEERIQEISKFIVGGRLPTAEKEMVIGIRLAEKLDLKINDKLTMMTKTQYNSLGMRTFRITGLLKTGMGLIDKKVFYVGIEDGNRLLKMNNPSSTLELFILIKDMAESRKVATKINDLIRKKTETLISEDIGPEWLNSYKDLEKNIMKNVKEDKATDPEKINDYLSKRQQIGLLGHRSAFEKDLKKAIKSKNIEKLEKIFTNSHIKYIARPWEETNMLYMMAKLYCPLRGQCERFCWNCDRW